MTTVVLNGWSGEPQPFPPSAALPFKRHTGDHNQLNIGKRLSSLRRFLTMESHRSRADHDGHVLHPSLAKKLPMEVILTIFDVAARSDQATARAISLVCRRARTIAAPEVYRFVAFSWGANLPSFLRFALSRSHMCPSIHNLWLGNHYAPARLLSRCNNLERIAMEPQSFIDYCTIREPPPVVHWSDACLVHNGDPRPPFRAHEVVLLSYPCDWSELDPTDEFTIASLQSITHLWLTRPSQLFTRTRCRSIIPCLSRVSHLGIKFDITPGGRFDMSAISREVNDLLQSLSSLKMLAVIVDYSAKRGKDLSRTHDFAKVLRAMDGRIYVVPMPLGSTDFVAVEEEVLPLFKASATGRGSLWDKARDFREELGTPRPQSWLPRLL